MAKIGPAVELRDVHREYASDGDGGVMTAALDGVSVTIERGDLVAICGPSGSGKSTLLHLAGALDKPTSGEVFIEGWSLASRSPAELAGIRNKSIGFVFQQFNLLPALTVAENVAVPAVLARRKPAEIKQRVDELLSTVGLADRADRKPGQLSGGEQQRVAIARALVLDPPIVLADEPTGNLDTASGEGVMELLLASHEAGRTVVIVTHDVRVAARTQRVVYLRDGRVSQEDKPKRQRSRKVANLLDTSPY
ncbi:MAG TPA: ABC transporter ATP-binding protein [Acidimicrobiales bacterium]|nr:ABC transporter ATP-binding protein [Acidimicrobiales bacterium]